MKLIKSVAPDLSVCVTNDNKLVIMIDNEDGEHLAEVTDVTKLLDTVRELAMDVTFGLSRRPAGPMTTAEFELRHRS